jgi:hypothetical protein
MNIQIYKTPREFLVVDNFYEKNELELIWQELDFLRPKLLDPEHTGSARSIEGKILKNNKGIFLDECYTKREISNILQLNRKIFCNEIIDNIKRNFGTFYKLYPKSNIDYTLVNYYENGGFYKPHEDDGIFTAISIFYKDPNSIKGGDLFFPEYGISIEGRSNRLVIFPSTVIHSVSDVETLSKTPGFGRYSISQFVRYNT